MKIKWIINIVFVDIVSLSQDDDEELFLNNKRHHRSKMFNFVEVAVYNMSDRDFKIQFRLTRRSIEVPT